jgi:hypothetical protein
VRQDLASRHEEADRLRLQHVERARYEADLAQRRFLKVDPDNRLVADALEADWNGKLRALAVAQETYEKTTAADATVATDAERADLMALVSDFPRLWRDPRTQMKEKKRMLRLLIEDVTLTKGDALHVDIRFAGGATRPLDLPLPKSCVELRTTDAEVVKEIDRLIDTYIDGEIADVLNERGVRTIVTTPWTAARIGRLRTKPMLSTSVLDRTCHKRQHHPATMPVVQPAKGNESLCGGASVITQRRPMVIS